MDALSGWGQATASDKLKAACTAQLGIALLLSIWGAEFGSAIAVLGLLAVALSLGELVKVVSCFSAQRCFSRAQQLRMSAAPEYDPAYMSILCSSSTWRPSASLST